MAIEGISRCNVYTRKVQYGSGFKYFIHGILGYKIKVVFSAKGKVFSLKITMTYIDTTFSSNYTIKEDVLYLLLVTPNFVVSKFSL